MNKKRSVKELWGILRNEFLKDRVWKCTYCPWYNNTQTHPYKCENCLNLCKIQKFIQLVKIKMLAIQKEKDIINNGRLKYFEKITALKSLSDETNHDTTLSRGWEEYNWKIEKNPIEVFHLLSPTKTGKSRDGAKMSNITWFH